MQYARLGLINQVNLTMIVATKAKVMKAKIVYSSVKRGFKDNKLLLKTNSYTFRYPKLVGTFLTRRDKSCR